MPQMNPQHQQQQQKPNYGGYIPPQNQPNINPQPQRFGPGPQNNPNKFPQQVGNIQKYGNLMKKMDSPNFPPKSSGKDDEFALFKIPSKATSSIYVDGIFL